MHTRSLRLLLLTPCLYGGLALLALLGGCKKEEPVKEAVRPVLSTRVAISDGSVGATYSGQVEARYESSLGFRVSGKILQRLVEVGDPVKKGQVLLRLDPQQESLQLTAAVADLDAARSRVEQAALEFERTKALLSQKYASQTEYDQQKLALDDAEAQLKSAMAQHQMRRNERGYTELAADRDGVVTAIEAEAGQVVAAGQTVIHVAGDGEREVRVSIPEARVAELRQAKRLDISIWANADKRYAGELRELAPDTDSLTRSYSARITVKNPDPDLLLGMTASVFAPDVAGAHVIRLPLSAIYDKEGQPLVWVIDPASATVSTLPVTLAGAEGDSVLVASGLKGGETVVTAGVHLLYPGQKVIPPNSDPDAAAVKPEARS